MPELLSVEYISKNHSKKEKDDKAALDGMIGEVDKAVFLRALRSLKQTIDDGGNGQGVKVPVRFNLLVPGSVVGFYPNWCLSRNDIAEQGVLVPIKNLRVTKRKPVSAYERIRMEGPMIDVKAVFEKEQFLYTNSKSMAEKALSFLNGILPHGWVWSKESRSLSADKPLVFLEARFYGADTILPVYASSRFQGIAVQVLARDVETGYNQPMTSDTYLLANTREYVEYVDGVVVERERLSSPLCSIVGSVGYQTPRDFVNKRSKKKPDAAPVVSAAG